MDAGTCKLLLLLLVVVCWLARGAASQRVGPCPFNTMCACRFQPSSEAVAEVGCTGVPLSLLPELPSGALEQVDIIDSGLEVLENDSLHGREVEFLRFMSNKLQYLDQEVFSSMAANIMSLDLSYNELDEVPFESLQHLTRLDWLNLHSNYITSIDTATRHGWSQAKNTLTTLFLGDNELTDLPQYRGGNLSPAALPGCRQLTWLNLDGNKLTKLEPGTLPLTLQTLSASRNLLMKFPAEVLDDMRNLAWLYLRGNYIDAIPEHTFPHKKHLDALDLGENVIEVLLPTMFNNTLTVHDFNLDYNFIKSIPPQAFGGMNVGRLYLSYNRLGTIDPWAFVGLGHTLEFLDMDHNDLHHVPKALRLLKRLNYLYLSYNNISVVAKDAFEGFAASLRALSLAGNFLRGIPKDSLQDCRSLTYFNIGYNKIDAVSSEDFEWAVSLETLFLQSNRITTLVADTFKRTPVLRELSLSFNKLGKVDPLTFAEISKTLQSLELSFSINKADSLVEILKPLKFLQWLSLDNNNLGQIASNSLYSFGKLQYLDLEYSHLDSISSELFNGDIHEHLRDVRLSHNNIDTIESDTFSSMNSLHTVVLIDNKLKSIATHAFDNIQNLVTIDLSENMITSISPRSFYSLPKIVLLNLQNNALNEFSLSAFYNVSSVYMPITLNLSHNNISSLQPSDTGSPVYMKSLDISHNQIVEVPVNFLQQFADSIRRLRMGHNLISDLNQVAFGTLGSLEVLAVDGNNVSRVSKDAFRGLDSLQVLDMSRNAVEQLQVQQFSGLRRLRVVDLSANKIRSLPRDAFDGTRLERLDLSANDIVAMPSSALAPVVRTLRRLDLSRNLLEHLDATMFPAGWRLATLRLADNRLTQLPDDVFGGLARLVRLDLSGNSLRARFPELLRGLDRLRHLGLAGAGLREAPRLPLPSLVSLDLSGNLLEDVPADAVEQLGHLQELRLASNRLPTVPATAWRHLPLLRLLVLSDNPIKIITKDSFAGLARLQELAVRDLPMIKRFDADTLTVLPALTHLDIQTWPGIERFRFRLGSVLSNVPSLRSLAVDVKEVELSDQLLGAFDSRLQHLDIGGAALRAVDADALEGVGNNHELVLRIRGTQIKEFPRGLFSELQRVSHLTVDISDNKFSTLKLSTIYSNSTVWENMGTTQMTGGLALAGNPWRCDCSLAAVGRWTRRWLRETAQTQSAVLRGGVGVGGAGSARALAAAATCTDPTTGRRLPIVQLPDCGGPNPADARASLGALPARLPLPLLLLLLVLQRNYCASGLGDGPTPGSHAASTRRGKIKTVQPIENGIRLDLGSTRDGRTNTCSCRISSRFKQDRQHYEYK